MLFVWSVSLTLENFHSFGDVTIVGEGLQILTYAWQFWPLRSEGFFYCATHTVAQDIRELVTLIPNAGHLAVELSLPAAAGIRTPNLPFAWRTV